MLGWLKYPQAFAEMFPGQWSFGERRESKRTFSLILNVLDHYLRTAHTLKVDMADPSQHFVCSFASVLEAGTKTVDSVGEVLSIK